MKKQQIATKTFTKEYDIVDFFDRLPKIFVFWLGISFIIFIGIFDYISGQEISFNLFYLLPIAMVTWFISRLVGVVGAIASTVSTIESDIILGKTIYSDMVIFYWNTGINFAFFLFVVIILGELKKILEHEKELSRTDTLTGVANRRYFFDISSKEVARANRDPEPITLAYIDLDNFKKVNDTMGHDIGDELLKTVSEYMADHLRAGDIVARLGGDEFALLLPNTGHPESEQILERLRTGLVSTMQKKKWPVTFSIGAAIFEIPPRNTDEMIKKADELMYSVKHTSKNMLKCEVIASHAQTRPQTQGGFINLK